MSFSTLIAWLVGAFVIAVAWLVSDTMPPPWPCRYDELARQPRALSLIDAARAACAGGADRATVDLDAAWPEGWRRLHLFRPYHGNHEVIGRVGFNLEIMACTRSRIADEWTQAVLETASGDYQTFDLPSHLLVDRRASLASGDARLAITCANPRARP